MYKLVWMDLLAYVIIYYTLSLVYRVALTEDEKRCGLIVLLIVVGKKGEATGKD